MEGALTWLFGSNVHRVPDGRTSSFTQPLLPFPSSSSSTSASSRATLGPPKGTLACPLPSRALNNHSNPRPRPATVGYHVDDWAEHHASYFTNSRGQRIFVQVWRPHPRRPRFTDSGADADSDDVGEHENRRSRNGIVSLIQTAVDKLGRLTVTDPMKWAKPDDHHTSAATRSHPTNPVPWSPSDRNATRQRRNAKEKGVVYIIHGLNDHSNKYTRVARAWVDAGWVVVAHDFHGHGRSDGFRAYTSSMDHYVRDAYDAVLHADRRVLPARLAKLPKFLLAHSLGGAVAIHLARDLAASTTAPSSDGAVKFNGAMLTAPAVRVFPKPLLKLFAPVIATLAPLLPVQRLKFDRRQRQRQRPAASASDDEYCPYEDPLVVRSPVRARVGYEVLKSCQRIMSEADRFKLPVFVAHSAHDRVTNAHGTVEFHSRIASDDKTVRLYPGSVHDLLADSRDLVVSDMIAWASHRLR